MKLLYLVTEETEKEIDNATKKSIDLNLKKGYEYIFINKFTNLEFENAYYKLHQLKFKQGIFDYVCIIPNGSTLTDKSSKLLEEYITDKTNTKKTILLPLIVLETKERKGVLNASLYNSENAVYGSLEQEDVDKHLDITLYGALIPFDLLLLEEIYNKELKIYQHYYMIKKLSALSIIQGIPKISMILNLDLSYESYSKEEKINSFKQAFEINN